MIKNGCQGEDVKSIQEILKKLGYKPGPLDGVFGEKTENAVIQFQESYCLYADGVVGQNTWTALHSALAVSMDEQVHPLTSHDKQGKLLDWVRVPADQYRDGYDRFFLREDAAAAYMKIREHVIKAGGKLTSSGARRALNAHVGASRSATSFHYIGRALDLFVGSGMENRAKDPFIVTPDEGRYWRVFARAEGGTEMELNAVTYGSRNHGKSITGKFIDITELFEKEGFKRIRARRSFLKGGSWLGAEWWHFQYEKGLEKGISTFGDELLKVYTERQLQGSPPWQYRNRIFNLDWF
ncbi:peptidoglycan-binding domain-containing protein [Spartinivicinus poritis]|uniref:Peptidoglycan-binding domain-containing protein n=1 Tax=Spartinivicinus poritis TaxID=2994640 RepID=A0ABT5UAW8_9GAMM|nr:peptidoglycan-binding domain-containing protein [Spartinivicinus sp. A2-2]MDE1463457.1 peptidoglycan-binding domain-containing protein [Spartinivicinus sp. A2-2]